MAPRPDAGTDSFRAAFDQAVAMQRQGNHKGAAKRLKRLLKDAPGNPLLLNRYALSLAELGDLKTAARALDRAIKDNPDHSDSWAALGGMQQRAGDAAAAARAWDRYRALEPDNARGHVLFADACLDLERFDDALAALDRALAIAPADPAALRGMAQARMFKSDWEHALQAAEASLARDPGNTLLLSILAIAGTELDRKEARPLFDFDRLIEVKDLEAPDGYADLKAFNAALCDYCLAHSTLVYEPGGKSTMKGHQTTDLSQERGKGPIPHLLARVIEAVRGYREAHAVEPGHPFLGQQPPRYGCYMWATVLDSQGHQAAHIHPSGWLSGVYYACIPDAVAASGEDHAGWIEFGGAGRYPGTKAGHPVRAYKPHEGMVVLFPSYMYHRTVPFEADQQRISIAFDLVPLP